ncbi:transcriptional regulator [Novosphingobium album (ex Liu et al. 2023)]|uniref:Transcriptional regulator n=1 Tax=Novosphingobium album (ex Liu et al. 2023) TaxID=3031130 RepID=A0ABT5WX22_9SPHN|nr:transcriptional regulator [Novosphingobium album (ex Liu et al. 2023)]MDE8654451.1 transcriptional regulator [Novosphingobium album (ex Liu et al. 2023)]
MTSQSNTPVDHAAVIAELKKIVGRRIEDQRLLQRMTQAKLAAKVGIGVRWLREIEMGGTRARLDDYLRCAHGVGLSSGQVFIPLLLLEHEKPIPSMFFIDHMHEIEGELIERFGPV